ncbi:MAG: hypothetical protein AAF741_19590 [Bacteroidota bacterium]
MSLVELKNIKVGQRAFMRPTITVYNRLEGRPRTHNFDRALKAEIRDPLWMISKQWQVGEFQGDDAASPVLAKLQMRTTRIDAYKGGKGSHISPLPAERPMEMVVERQRLGMRRAAQVVHLDLRLAAGRYWKKLLKSEGGAVADLIDAYKEKYSFTDPDPAVENDHTRSAHPRTWQRFRAVAGRSIDGYAIIEDVLGGGTAFDRLDSSPPAEVQNQLTALFGKLQTWWNGLFQQQDEPNDSWQPERLEHKFAVSAPNPDAPQVRTGYVAEEYYQGHLDWYNLDAADEPNGSDIEPANAQPEVKEKVIDFFPTNISFGGMPDPRWWTLEERETSFVGLKPDTTDLNKLLVMDFQLQFANDWFLLPLGLEVGTVARVKGLMITDSFGEKTWVEHAGQGDDQDWERWSMFHPSIAGDRNVPASNDLLMLPAVPTLLEGKPLEEVRLLRDEMANMVWGLESQITLPDGQPRRGKEAARELRARYQSNVAVPPPDVPPADTPGDSELIASAKYKIVNSVPECWIPFIPVHRPGQQQQIELQRAAMPRILPGDTEPPQKIEPRTNLLRQGLDEMNPQPYFLREEEVPRAGAHVRLSFQRTRWYNGRVYTWLGIRKTTGRGEGSSGLKFDYLEN